MIRQPSHDDIPNLARIHVQAWEETYRGLLPDAELARRDLLFRSTLWARLLRKSDLRTAYAPGIGFAQMGPQRDAGFAAQGYTEELYSLYVLSAHHRQGYGRNLLRAVVGTAPFTALKVAAGNPAACFYPATGARHLETRTVTEDGYTFEEDAFGWKPPFTF